MTNTHMRLVNQITEVTSHIAELKAYVQAVLPNVLPPEAKLLQAQASAMGLVLEVLTARLYLMTGTRP